MASVQFERGKHTTRQACSGSIPHDFRERENYGNQDIDKSRSFLNQKFGCQTGAEARKKLQNRIAECDTLHPPKRVPSDRKTSLEIHIPAPRENLDDEQLKIFYEKVYADMEKFFGKSNVIYGVTHFDEIHEYKDSRKKKMQVSRSGLHLVIIPWTDDASFVPQKDKAGLNMHNFYKRGLPNMVNKRLDAICQQVFGFDYQDGSKNSNHETVDELKAGEKAITEQHRQQVTNQRILAQQELNIKDKQVEYEEESERLIKLKKRNKELQSHNTDLIQQNDDLIQEQKSLSAQNRNLQQQLKQTQATLNVAEIRIKFIEDGLSEAQQEWYETQQEEFAANLANEKYLMKRSLEEWKADFIARQEKANQQKLAEELKQQVSDVKAYRQWKRSGKPVISEPDEDTYSIFPGR